MDLPSAAFPSHNSTISSATAMSVGCHSSSHSIQITINQKKRWMLPTKGLNAWLDLQERELCIIYMKEETPSFSKPLPDQIPQQQQWLYLSCSLLLSRCVPTTANPKVCQWLSTVFGQLFSSALRRSMQW
jgi:hypothetical protein